LPDGLTPHSLRRTFASILFATGRELPYVMAQLGHADPKMTLSVYARVMLGGADEKGRLGDLVGGNHGQMRSVTLAEENLANSAKVALTR
jgi:site-specific recombinase XerD